MSDFFLRLLKDPCGSVKRALLKIFILPIKYGRGQDYNAAGYWKDRFQRYSTAMKGVGCEGFSEEYNIQARDKALRIVESVCHQESVLFDRIRVLEIGCGNGFYTAYLQRKGVRDYTGIDITDVLFGVLKAKFPSFGFRKQDITADKIDGQYDIVVMMDVVQHIVSREKLLAALNNIKGCLNPNGVFIVAPITSVSKKHLFHVHYWSENELNEVFKQGYSKRHVGFREKEDLVVIKKK